MNEDQWIGIHYIHYTQKCLYFISEMFRNPFSKAIVNFCNKNWLQSKLNKMVHPASDILWPVKLFQRGWEQRGVVHWTVPSMTHQSKPQRFIYHYISLFKKKNPIHRFCMPLNCLNLEMQTWREMFNDETKLILMVAFKLKKKWFTSSSTDLTNVI